MPMPKKASPTTLKWPDKGPNRFLNILGPGMTEMHSMGVWELDSFCLLGRWGGVLLGNCLRSVKVKSLDVMLTAGGHSLSNKWRGIKIFGASTKMTQLP